MTAPTTWAAGLVVAAAAAAATAHGAFEVARAAGVPTPVAGLYPPITDGLALVAYATTTRLAARGRRYAWAVVVLASGLSGLAQAALLAGGVRAAPTWLRAGVGAWPAIAAAVVAHLLYLLGAGGHPAGRPSEVETVHLYNCVEPLDTQVGRLGTCLARPAGTGPIPIARSPRTPADPARTAGTERSAAQRDRAQAAARTHRERHGQWPSVRQLADAADIACGTAAAALKTLRTDRPDPSNAAAIEPWTDR
jgi:hypothetical protein